MKVALVVWFLLYALFMVMDPLDATASDAAAEQHICELLTDQYVEYKADLTALEIAVEMSDEAEKEVGTSPRWIRVKDIIIAEKLMTENKVAYLKLVLNSNCKGVRQHSF
jgi:hypothetical protein